MEESEDEISMVDIQENYLDDENDENDQESDETETGKRYMNIPKLYSLLEEKNQAIEELKKKLTNQQIQLAYYLSKNLQNNAVLSFSNECIPDLADDNMQLSLAMYKFVRDTGRKSRLSILKDRLEQYDQRVQDIILQQEQFIEKRVANDKEWMKHNEEKMDCDEESNDEFENQDYDMDENIKKKYDLKFQDRALHVANLDLCSNLTYNILKVRKELKQFRQCAEKITDLEAERNTLVEQVYSLTAEERFNAACTNFSDEQQNPETQTQEILNNNTNQSISSEGKETEANNVETENAVSIQNISRSKEKCSDELKRMLSTIQIETIKVMLLSKKQRKRFSSELYAIRKENKILKKRLRSMEELTTNESMLELQQKCFRIGQDIQELHRCFEFDSLEKDKEIQRMIQERRVKNVEEIRLKEEVTQLRATIEVIRADRDSLQRRLETNEKMTDNMKICEMKNKEIMELNDIIIMQDKQIKDLLTILSRINTDKLQKNENSYKANNNKKRKASTREVNNKNVGNHNPKIDIKIKNSSILRNKSPRLSCSKKIIRDNINQNFGNNNTTNSKQSTCSSLEILNLNNSETLTLHNDIVNLQYDSQSNHMEEIINDLNKVTDTYGDNSKSTEHLHNMNISCENTTQICSEQFETDTDMVYVDDTVSLTMANSQEEMDMDNNEVNDIKPYHESQYLMNETIRTPSEQTPNNIIPLKISSESFLSPDSSTTEIDDRLAYLISHSDVTRSNEIKSDITEIAKEYDSTYSKTKFERDDAYEKYRCPSCESFNGRRSRHVSSQMSNTATTSLRVEACNENGQSESMQAILECTSPHEGFLEMENSSKLRLRLECASPSRCNHSDHAHSNTHSRSCLSSSERNIVGDFIRTSNITKEARMQLSNHLKKMKSDLEKCQTTPQYNAASETYSESCTN